MIYIYDRNENQVATLDVEPRITLEVGKIKTLEFESDIEFGKDYRVLYKFKHQWHEFIITEPSYERVHSFKHSYQCDDSVIELRYSYIDDKRPSGTLTSVMDRMLENTRWNAVVGDSYLTSSISQRSFYRTSVFECFAELVKDYNFEWETRITVSGNRVTNREIILNKIGMQLNSRLEFEKNIINFKRTILQDDIYTALFGYGKGEEITDEEGEPTGGYGRRIDFGDLNGGLKYITNETARDLYGLGEEGSKQHKFGVVIFEDIEDKQELLDRTTEELEVLSVPRVEYEINVADVDIDGTYGDTVGAIDDYINFRGYLRIVRVEGEGNELKYTLGTRIESFTTKTTRDAIEKEKQIERISQSVMGQIIGDMTNYYWNEDGHNYELTLGNEYGLPAGYYSFDKLIGEDPTKVIYMGAGKILIANRKDTQGNWIWTTGMDGDGMHGDAIVSNSITANKLASDVGQSLDLSSNESIINRVSRDEIQNLVSTDTQDAELQKLRDDITAFVEGQTQLTENSFDVRFKTQTEIIEKNAGEVDTRLNNMEAYFRVTPDGLELGNSENPIILKIKPDRITFEEGGHEVAYISDSSLYITHANIVDSMQWGKFRWVHRDNGNFSLV